MPNWPGCEKVVGEEMKSVRNQSLQVQGRVGRATEGLRDGGVDPCPCLGPGLRLGKKCGQVLVGDKRRGRRVGLDWIGMCKGGNEELEDDDNTL